MSKTVSKYVIFTFNSIIAVSKIQNIWYTIQFFVILQICAIILIIFGAIYVVNEEYGVSVFSGFSMGGLTIGIATVIFLTAFLGCCGSVIENTCLLTIVNNFSCGV